MKPERSVEILLKVIYSEPKDLLSDYLTSLGEGGLFINTTVPLEVGDRLAFSISFPGLLRPREFRGVVRWQTTRREAIIGIWLPRLKEVLCHRSPPLH